MRLEKAFGFAGLGAFFLFPLVGLLQMSDSESTWRAVAARTAPSVWPVETPAGGPSTCGVVVTRDPLRLAVAGAHAQAVSRLSGGTVHWRAAHVDPGAQFTILVATGVRPVADGIAIDPAVIGDLDALGEPGIETILVGPLDAGGALVSWLGELSVERRADGRPSFRAAALRPMHADSGALAATAAPSFDPALCGAPFVTRDGVVLALCAGIGDGVVRAVPMALVREAVSLLDRRAAR